MLGTTFTRWAEVWNVRAKHIFGEEWFCTDKNGKGIIATTGAGSAPTPPDYVLMSLGACLGSGVRFMLEKRGKACKNLTIEVEGEFGSQPQRRIKEMRVKVSVESDVAKDVLDKIVKQVEEKMCPVGGTLLNPPVIKCTT